MQGRVRRNTLEALEKGPRTPSSIAQSTGEYLTHVSRALKEMVDRGLVECMTPEQSKNRIYRITDNGRETLAHLRKMHDD
ncbi:MAG: winged helix-turn-helix domain-containing protein [Methanomassiliicoccales archaeon]